MSNKNKPDVIPVLWFNRNGCGPDEMAIELEPLPALMDGTDLVAPATLGLRVRSGGFVMLGEPMVDGGFQLASEQVADLHRQLGAWLASTGSCPGSTEREARQAKIFAWAQAAFSIEQATSLTQRGLRLLEEAIETFQAAGGDPAQAHQLVGYVFEQPAGELGQELGGVGVCLLALGAAAGLSADAEEQREVTRVLAKPVEEFTRRNDAKNAAGFLAHPARGHQ